MRVDNAQDGRCGEVVLGKAGGNRRFRTAGLAQNAIPKPATAYHGDVVRPVPRTAVWLGVPPSSRRTHLGFRGHDFCGPTHSTPCLTPEAVRPVIQTNFYGFVAFP